MFKAVFLFKPFQPLVYGVVVKYAFAFSYATAAADTILNRFVSYLQNFRFDIFGVQRFAISDNAVNVQPFALGLPLKSNTLILFLDSFCFFAETPLTTALLAAITALLSPYARKYS